MNGVILKNMNQLKTGIKTKTNTKIAIALLFLGVSAFAAVITSSSSSCTGGGILMGSCTPSVTTRSYQIRNWRNPFVGRVSLAPSLCGNGIIDGTEQCDGTVRAPGIFTSLTCDSSCHVRGNCSTRPDSCRDECAVLLPLCRSEGSGSEVFRYDIAATCSPGTHCVDATCVAGGSCVARTCSRSGTTTNWTEADGSEHSYSDWCPRECLANVGGCLSESSGGGIGIVPIPCGSGTRCSGGACVPSSGSCEPSTPTCTRSGSTTTSTNSEGDTSTYSDSCTDGCHVTQHLCSPLPGGGSGTVTKYLPCGSGTHCVDGACVAGGSC